MAVPKPTSPLHCVLASMRPALSATQLPFFPPLQSPADFTPDVCCRLLAEAAAGPLALTGLGSGSIAAATRKAMEADLKASPPAAGCLCFVLCAAVATHPPFRLGVMWPAAVPAASGYLSWCREGGASGCLLPGRHTF